MLIWFLIALASAVTNSVYQAYTNYLNSLGRFSKFTIIFYATAIASMVMFGVSYFVVGVPEIKAGFFYSAFTASLLIFIAAPIMLKAYELDEFSKIYSLILLTPIFNLLTSFLFLQEIPSFYGILGVAATVWGLTNVVRTNQKPANRQPHNSANSRKGVWLGILVAFIFSISTNFDKLSALYSDAFFAAATVNGGIAVFCLIYLIFMHRGRLVRRENIKPAQSLILIPAGLILVLSQILHYSALLRGLVAYTIAIRRLGILFGIFWGWLFFKEDNISKKFLGASIAIAGVLLIIFS